MSDLPGPFSVKSQVGTPALPPLNTQSTLGAGVGVAVGDGIGVSVRVVAGEEVLVGTGVAVRTGADEAFGVRCSSSPCEAQEEVNPMTMRAMKFPFISIPPRFIKTPLVTLLQHHISYRGQYELTISFC